MTRVDAVALVLLNYLVNTHFLLSLSLLHTQVSKEGDTFSVTVQVAQMSVLVTSMMEDTDDGEGIPLPNVSGVVLQKVIEFCTHYLVEPMTEIEKPLKSDQMSKVVNEWYATYVDALEHELLFEIMKAANYMDCKPLLGLCCATVASKIKGKTPEEVRATFGKPEKEVEAAAAAANDKAPDDDANDKADDKKVEEKEEATDDKADDKKDTEKKDAADDKAIDDKVTAADDKTLADDKATKDGKAPTEAAAMDTN